MTPKGERGAWPDYKAIRHLISPATPARINAPVVWDCTRGTKYSMRIPVEAPAGPWGALQVEMTGNTHRPSEPTISYFCGLGFVHRVCVNGAHPPFTGSHEHRVTEAGVSTAEPRYMTIVPRTKPVTPGAWEAIFREFIDECGIALGPSFAWQPPWEGA